MMMRVPDEGVMVEQEQGTRSQESGSLEAVSTSYQSGGHPVPTLGTIQDLLSAPTRSSRVVSWLRVASISTYKAQFLGLLELLITSEPVIKWQGLKNVKSVRSPVQTATLQEIMVFHVMGMLKHRTASLDLKPTASLARLDTTGGVGGQRALPDTGLACSLP